MRFENKNQLQQYIQTVGSYILQLRDARFAGQVLFAIVVILVSWSGVKAIDANYVLQKQIAALQQQNDVKVLENGNLKLQNDYYNSNQYLELSARQNFGLAASGEKELLVSNNVALSYTVQEPVAVSSHTTDKIPTYQRNLQAWVNFYLNRKPPQD